MRLVLARLGWTAAILLLVVSGSFFLVRLVPGGPFDQEKVTDPAIRANLMAAYDMDAPLGAQYARYLRNVLHGDFGPSLRYRDYSLNQILAESLPISALLGACALVVALAVGLSAGALAAARRGSWIDTAVMGASTLGIALPSFVLAGLLVLLFAFQWRLFPVAGYGSPAQLVLPAVALGLPFAASIGRLFRAGLVEGVGQGWGRRVRANGQVARAGVAG